jgi:hypothetical protein
MKTIKYGNSCDEVHVQTRKIGPTKRSVSGRLAFRGETSLSFESTLERDFLLKAEFSLSVLDVVPQPVAVPFRGVNGQSYTYTPDFLIYYRLGDRAYGDYPKPVLVEVKPEKEWRANWRKWLPKWKAAWRYAKAQGWEFHIHDESRIRDEALTNIRMLERYKRMQFDAEERVKVIDTVRTMGCTTADYLLARHFMGIYRAEGISLIWHLLSVRQLDCDITQPLNQFTNLWIPGYE